MALEETARCARRADIGTASCGRRLIVNRLTAAAAAACGWCDAAPAVESARAPAPACRARDGARLSHCSVIGRGRSDARAAGGRARRWSRSPHDGVAVELERRAAADRSHAHGRAHRRVGRPGREPRAMARIPARRAPLRRQGRRRQVHLRGGAALAGLARPAACLLLVRPIRRIRSATCSARRFATLPRAVAGVPANCASARSTPRRRWSALREAYVRRSTVFERVRAERAAPTAT